MQRQPMECHTYTREVASLDELHHEKRVLVGLHEVIDADDVIVRERSERPCLTRLPPRCFGSAAMNGRRSLIATSRSRLVSRAPDGTHPAFTDLLDQLVPVSQDRHRPFSIRPRSASPPASTPS